MKRGYMKPIQPPGKIVMEMTMVGCKNCNTTWSEECPQLENGVRINGPLYIYDHCSDCITDEILEQYSDHGGILSTGERIGEAGE